jgi:farnesyl diphosphate synthase
MDQRMLYSVSAQTFNQRLTTSASLMEARLTEWLTPIAATGFVPDRLAAAMRHGTLGGGKRLRPFLIIESAALFGVPAEAALDAGAALECIHCYSLVHDDLPAMDDDDLRRGRPTVHKAYNEATAILTGDSLLTLAFEIMASPRTHPDGAVRAHLVLELAKASGWAGMAGGQQLDLEAPGKTLGEPEIRQLQAMKTGALIKFACEAGGILGGADAHAMAALTAYGERLGRAFQLADDILDVEGDAAVVGKATAKDQDAGKATLVGVYGLAPAKTKLAKMVDSAKAALEPFEERAGVLRAAAEFVAARQA